MSVAIKHSGSLYLVVIVAGGSRWIVGDVDVFEGVWGQATV